MTSLRDSLGLPVIAADTAEQIGTASGAVVDVDNGRLAAVHLGSGKKSTFVSWGDITSFGADAVMVSRAASVHDSSNELEERALSGDGTVLDKRMLTDTGDEIGPVADVEFDAAGGALEWLRVGADRVESDRLIGIGAYAVVVKSLEE